MTFREVKPWEWVVAALLLLLGVWSAVQLAGKHLGLPVEGTLELLPPLGKTVYMVFTVVYTVVLLWALGGMYRMAQWQERHAGLMGAFMAVVAADELCNLVQTALVLYTDEGVAGLDFFTALFSVLEMLTMLMGIVVTVRLFLDDVRPLGTILVAFVLLPVVFRLLWTPAWNTVVSLLLMTVVVALMFLFRRAPGRMDEDDE